jgi:CheY-like chemotaxis protein
MAELNGFQIIIVDADPKATCHLRHVLIGRGAKVHVFEGARRALTMARQNRVDGAFVQYDVDHATRELCAHLRQLNIPVIFVPSDIAQAPREFAARLSDLESAA